MIDNLIDLSQLKFWLFCVLAAAFLTPITHAVARRWCWAAVNVAFVAMLLGLSAAPVVVALLLAYLILRPVAAGWNRGLTVLVAGIGVFALFLVHKLPPLWDSGAYTTAKAILMTVGFSYIALRFVDVLRAVAEGRHPAPDLASTINYLLPFHMLAAGPIQSYDHFVNQPVVPDPLTARGTLGAIERIAWGVFKKFVLAYMIRKTFLTDFESSGLYFFLEVQLFFLWLYLDFSAIADIAVGVGRLLGVATPENFNRPYLARNIGDFWDRWHMSLSQFIRRNIFLPLQIYLSRRSDDRHPLTCASLAFLVSFVLCGLWHGLTVNFLIWGTVHALGLVTFNAYRYWLREKLGAAGVRRYNANPWIRMGATVVTYEFVSFSLVALFYP